MSTNRRPLLSLTMIVKNEETDLARCLERARPLCDELIVVDTGSTDRTVEIARHYGAQVHFFEWCDDFAAARNAALAHATGEWVLHLDADEEAIESAPGALRAELAGIRPEVLFLRVPVRSGHPDAIGYDVYGARRLFRNRSDVRWRRRIHENIAFAGPETPEMDGSCASLQVEHHGYADMTVRRARGKITRNMRLLKAEMAANPDDPANYYYVSREYAAQNKTTTALRLLRTAIRRFGTQIRPDLLGAFYVLAMRCAIALDNPRLAIKLGTEAAGKYAYSELCYVLGCAYRLDGDLVQAERYLELAVALRGRFAEYQLDAGTGSWKALLQLGDLLQSQGRTDEALLKIERAHEWAPEQPLTNLALGRIYLAAGRPADALGPLKTATRVAPNVGESHLRLTQALVMVGERQEAYDRLDALVSAHPEVPDYWHWLGDLLYECGEYEACMHVLGRAIEQHTEHAGIYARLGAAMRQLGRYQDSLNAYALATALDPESTGARAGLALAAHAVEWNLPAPTATPQQFIFSL